jgi:hypothetical protein
MAISKVKNWSLRLQCAYTNTALIDALKFEVRRSTRPLQKPIVEPRSAAKTICGTETRVSKKKSTTYRQKLDTPILAA